MCERNTRDEVARVLCDVVTVSMNPMMIYSTNDALDDLHQMLDPNLVIRVDEDNIEIVGGDVSKETLNLCLQALAGYLKEK